MTDTTCALCEAATGDAAALCQRCTQDVLAALWGLPERYADLEDTAARLDVISDDRPAQQLQGLHLAKAETDAAGRPFPGTLRPMALPFAPHAADLATACRSTLGSWCRLLAEELHPDAAVGTDLPEDTVEATSTYLVQRVAWWRRQSWGADLASEVLELRAGLEAAVDRREAQMYLGQCRTPLRATQDAPGGTAAVWTGECAEHLYADAGADYATCRNCGAQHEVRSRRAWLLAQADDRLAHAELIAGALSGLGVSVNVDQVRGWARRGRMDQHGVDSLGRKLFRVGDAVDIATKLAAGGSQALRKRVS